MSQMNVSNVTQAITPSTGPQPAKDRNDVLRQKIDEMVGLTFFGKMMEISRNSVLKGEYGHGGRGEEIFGRQLDMELAQRAAARMKNGLSEAIYRRLTRAS